MSVFLSPYAMSLLRHMFERHHARDIRPSVPPKCCVEGRAEGGTMQRVPKCCSLPSVGARCEMKSRTSVLVPVRHHPPKSAVGRRDCPQICPQVGAVRSRTSGTSAVIPASGARRCQLRSVRTERECDGGAVVTVTGPDCVSSPSIQARTVHPWRCGRRLH
jgi:hypothetical protein